MYLYIKIRLKYQPNKKSAYECSHTNTAKLKLVSMLHVVQTPFTFLLFTPELKQFDRKWKFCWACLSRFCGTMFAKQTNKSINLKNGGLGYKFFTIFWGHNWVT